MKAISELTFPLSMLTTIMYWTAYYEPGWLDLNDFSTYYDSLFIHGLPLLILAIDWIFNNIIYDYDRGFWRMLWLIISYFPINYFAENL